MPESKIMEIIEKEQHITVKLENRPLLQRLQNMEEKGMIELADVFRSYYYYRKAGSTWRFFTPDELDRRGEW